MASPPDDRSPSAGERLTHRRQRDSSSQLPASLVTAMADLRKTRVVILRVQESCLYPTLCSFRELGHVRRQATNDKLEISVSPFSRVRYRYRGTQDISVYAQEVMLPAAAEDIRPHGHISGFNLRDNASRCLQSLPPYSKVALPQSCSLEASQTVARGLD